MTPVLEELGRVLRFGTVGLIVAGQYSLSFALILEVGVTTVLANLLAYLGAILVQFICHRSFTFRATDSLGPAILRFLIANGLGLALSTALAVLLRDGLGYGGFATGAVVSVTLAAMNWVVFSRWVFRT